MALEQLKRGTIKAVSLDSGDDINQVATESGARSLPTDGNADVSVGANVHDRFLNEVKASRKRRDQARQEGQVQLTDGQLKVCAEMLIMPERIAHAYGIKRILQEKYPNERVLSETAISNILARLEDLELAQSVPGLRQNTFGPARREYRLVDPDRAFQIVASERERRRQLVESLTKSLCNAEHLSYCPQ